VERYYHPAVAARKDFHREAGGQVFRALGNR
jgi:hypothetical protein